MKKFCSILFAVIATLLQVRADWTLSADGPEKISEHVSIIFTRDITEVIYMPLRDLKYLQNHESFDPKLPTAVYVHGWLESGMFDLSTLAIRGAYIDRADHNIITVDWSYYSKDINYLEVIPQLKVIAETMAASLLKLVDSGFDIKMLHLIGHSLGGQMVGKIGRHIKALSGGKVVIPRIFALDPAGPGFESIHIDGFEAISRTDGAYVQIIHTNAGFLGMQSRVGHIDFYPNGGETHPGCNVDVAASVIKTIGEPCDHFRSWQFYQLSVRNPKAFPAVRCDSWEDFLTKSDNCYYDDVEYMGFGANVTNTGKYFLQTNSNIFNLARGIKGIRYNKAKRTRLHRYDLVPKVTSETLPASTRTIGTKESSEIPEKVMKNLFF